MASTHTSFRKGSRIRIIFRDGTSVIAKFIETLGDKWMRVRDNDGKIIDVSISEIRSCNYYKPLPHEVLR